MAYCGVLDGIMSIDGQEADLSRLDEGIIIAGDENFIADELISDEIRLEHFNEINLRTKAELLKDIDDRIVKCDDDKQAELVRCFRAEVEKKTFPENLEDWWYYDYEVDDSGMKLSLCHATGFSINIDDSCDEYTDTVFDLIHISKEFVSVKEGD